MPKTQTQRGDEAGPIRPEPPPLSANIRRHLGSNLRTLYDQIPAPPVDERIAALLARLGTSKA